LLENVLDTAKAEDSCNPNNPAALYFTKAGIQKVCKVDSVSSTESSMLVHTSTTEHESDGLS
jgi:hypothetical protein